MREQRWSQTRKWYLIIRKEGHTASSSEDSFWSDYNIRTAEG